MSAADLDLIFTVGVVVALLAVPAIFSAVVDGRRPRAAAIAVLIGIGLIAVAAAMKPGGYPLGRIPEAMLGVLARLF